MKQPTAQEYHKLLAHDPLYWRIYEAAKKAEQRVLEKEEKK